MIKLFCLSIFFSTVAAWAGEVHAAPVFQISCASCDPLAVANFESQAERAFGAVVQILGVEAEFASSVFQVQFLDLHDHFGEAHVEGQNQIIKIDKGILSTWKAQIVFAHELTHLIRFHFCSSDSSWSQEGLAGLVESLYVGLWPSESEAIVARSPVLKLSENDADSATSAGSDAFAQIFFQYLYGHLGQDGFIQAYIRNPKAGWDAVEAVAVKLGEEKKHFIPLDYLDRLSLWRHFGISLFLNDDRLGPSGIFFLADEFHPLQLSKDPPELQAILNRPWAMTLLTPADAARALVATPKEGVAVHLYGLNPPGFDEMVGIVSSPDQLPQFKVFLAVTADR